MNTSRRTISVALVIFLAVIVLAITLSRKFSAEEKATETVTNSLLTVIITEAGRPALGLLYINGDCPKKTLSSQAGMFSCDLKVTGRDYTELRSLAFQSFTSNQRYPITLQKRREPRPLRFRGNSKIFLEVTISEKDGVQVREVSDEGLQLLDLKTGPKNTLQNH